MPTGYTAGVVSGKAKTFPEFAKLCMKAFGACLHMRDDSMDKPYRPRKVDKFYTERLKEAKFNLENIKTLSDDEIISNHKKYLKGEIINAKKRIREIYLVRCNLNMMLMEAANWKPPTKEHQGVKDFMIQQLTDTLEHDGNSYYFIEKLASAEKQMKAIDPIKIKEELIKDAEEDVARYTKSLKEEEERRRRDNSWVDVFIKSLEK